MGDSTKRIILNSGNYRPILSVSIKSQHTSPEKRPISLAYGINRWGIPRYYVTKKRPGCDLIIKDRMGGLAAYTKYCPAIEKSNLRRSIRYTIWAYREDRNLKPDSSAGEVNRTTDYAKRSYFPCPLNRQILNRPLQHPTNWTSDAVSYPMLQKSTHRALDAKQKNW